MEEYLEKERKLYAMSTDERDAQLFNFAKTRIKEIERWVSICFKAEKQIDQQRVTKLDNEAAAKSIPEVQKELLDGRYKIKLRDELPYQQKIVKMAQEPVAFQLYKKRHFYALGSKGDGARQPRVKGDFKNDLLKIANARIIHKHKFR